MLPQSSGQSDGLATKPAVNLTDSKPIVFRPVPDHLSPTSGLSTPNPSSTPASARSSLDQSQARSPALQAADINENEPREIILQAYLPRVAVYASQDTEELVRLKGIYGGLCGLLQPFGERVQGKVVIRDSVGASKSWNDFGVHFVRFGQDSSKAGRSVLEGPRDSVGRTSTEGDWSQILKNNEQADKTTSLAVDEVVRHEIQEHRNGSKEVGSYSNARLQGATPPYRSTFLRKLLSSRPTVAHETFTHPVACVIAVSSQSSDPIGALRDLYSDTRQESNRIPPWMSNEFLRYYVLVHDEDNDDITKSMALFAQMKRHFGLHCHLVRLRSVECSSHDEDGMQLPACHWLTAETDLADINRKEQNLGFDEFKQYLFDTDAAVIRTFVRELVTQSVIVFMESRVTAWNDQVAARRRGISGRFMSLSKRFTGFGAARGAKANGSGGSYNTEGAYYALDSPEMTLHRLSDFAFMLRDWKLAESCYTMLITDFADDKAWNHHAMANEMCAASALLRTSRPKAEAIDQTLDTASYSYITRCSDVTGAARCLIIAVELLLARGGSATEEAFKWGDRLLELGILSPLVQALFVERLATCFGQPGRGLLGFGTKTRKGAFWNYISAKVWFMLEEAHLGRQRLEQADLLYRSSGQITGLPEFETMNESWQKIRDELEARTVQRNEGISKPSLLDDSLTVEETIQGTGEGMKLRHSNGFLSPDFEIGGDSDDVEIFHRMNDPLDQGDDGFS